MSETSDLDLLIINKAPTSFYERLREIALSCPWLARADFLAYTPNELDPAVKKIKFLRLKDRSNDPEITNGMALT